MGEGVSTISTKSRQRSGSERISRVNQTRQTSGAVDMNSRKFKSAITRAHNYTDENFHGEARQTVAKAFGYNDLADRYKKVNAEHEKVGSLTPSLSERRNSIDDELEKRIRRDYGEDGIRQYNRGLS